MAEPTCVMSSFSCTPQENENPMYGLADSVSFGRYMTEDLSWERWSSFNDNNNRKRYVEEAEKYSRPGSVAKKKAYFEAHFKRVAALKAAALEQEDSFPESVEFQGEVGNGELGHEFSSFGQSEVNDSIKGRVEKESVEKDIMIVVEKHENGDSSLDVEKKEVDVELVKEEEKEGPTNENVSLDQVEKNLTVAKDENCNGIKEGSSSTTQVTVPSPLQEINSKEQASKSIVKKNPPLSSYLPLLDGISRTPVFTPSPAKSSNSLYAGKENYATPIKQKSSTDDPDKKGTPLHTSINREFNKMLSPVIKKIGSSSQPSKNVSPAKVSVNGIAEASCLNSNFAKRGDISHLDSGEPRQNNLSSEFKAASTCRNKASSSIVPSCFCWRSRDRTARKKQEKAKTRFNRFCLSFCFKAMPSTESSNAYETHKSATSENITSSASRKPKLNGSRTVEQKTNGN